MEPLLLTIVILTFHHLPIPSSHTVAIFWVNIIIHKLLLLWRCLYYILDRFLFRLFGPCQGLVYRFIVLYFVFQVVFDHLIAVIYHTQQLIRHSLFLSRIPVHFFLFLDNVLVLGFHLGRNLRNFLVLHFLKLGLKLLLLEIEPGLQIFHPLIQKPNQPGKTINIIGIGPKFINKLFKISHGANTT